MCDRFVNHEKTSFFDENLRREGEGFYMGAISNAGRHDNLILINFKQTFSTEDGQAGLKARLALYRPLAGSTEPKIIEDKMNKVLIAVLTIILTSCSETSKKGKIMENVNKTNNKKSVKKDTTPKVTGIGGIFFYSDNPKETNEWYSKNLGVEINDWGSSSFDSRDIDNPDKINSLQWKSFKNGDKYFAPSKKGFMINYLVQNIEGLVAKLKKNGVTILDSIETYDYGKFVHIMDNDGNKIELWEPTE